MTAPEDRLEPSLEDAAMHHEQELEEAVEVASEVPEQPEFSHNENDRIGEALRIAREEKKWTVDDVAQLLKVRANMIKSLENGEIDPKAWIYVKGFYKTYTDLLGVDREGLPELQQPSGMRGVVRYSALAGKAVFCQELSDENIPKPVEPPIKLYITLVVVGLLALVAAIYFVVMSTGFSFDSLEKAVPAKIMSAKTQIISKIPTAVTQQQEPTNTEVDPGFNSSVGQ